MALNYLGNTRNVHAFLDLNCFGMIRGRMKHLGGFEVVPGILVSLLGMLFL